MSVLRWKGSSRLPVGENAAVPWTVERLPRRADFKMRLRSNHVVWKAKAEHRQPTVSQRAYGCAHILSSVQTIIDICTLKPDMPGA